MSMAQSYVLVTCSEAGSTCEALVQRWQEAFAAYPAILHLYLHIPQTALQAFLPTRMAHHAVELRVLVGHPFERILETAVHEKVALIVLGTHGRTGLAHLTMGSVAERVVRLAPCPVLTVQTSTTDDKGA